MAIIPKACGSARKKAATSARGDVWVARSTVPDMAGITVVSAKLAGVDLQAGLAAGLQKHALDGIEIGDSHKCAGGFAIAEFHLDGAIRH